MLLESSRVSLLQFHTHQQTPGAEIKDFMIHCTACSTCFTFSRVLSLSLSPIGVMRRWTLLDIAHVVGCFPREEVQAQVSPIYKGTANSSPQMGTLFLLFWTANQFTLCPGGSYYFYLLRLFIVQIFLKRQSKTRSIKVSNRKRHTEKSPRETRHKLVDVSSQWSNVRTHY